MNTLETLLEEASEKRFNRLLLSYQLEKEFNWQKWIHEIPYISFPSEWSVKVIPPYNGSIIRFLVKLKTEPDSHRISVFLDCYDVQGSVGYPYWKIYPDKEGCPLRIPMNNVDEFLTELNEALN